MAVVFKSDVDVGAEATMDKFDTELRSKVSTLGLCNVSVITPVYGVALAMANVVDVTNVESLVYSHTEFAEAEKSETPRPLHAHDMWMIATSGLVAPARERHLLHDPGGDHRG